MTHQWTKFHVRLWDHKPCSYPSVPVFKCRHWYWHISWVFGVSTDKFRDNALACRPGTLTRSVISALSAVRLETALAHTHLNGCTPERRWFINTDWRKIVATFMIFFACTSHTHFDIASLQHGVDNSTTYFRTSCSSLLHMLNVECVRPPCYFTVYSILT